MKLLKKNKKTKNQTSIHNLKMFEDVFLKNLTQLSQEKIPDILIFYFLFFKSYYVHSFHFQRQEILVAHLFGHFNATEIVMRILLFCFRIDVH